VLSEIEKSRIAVDDERGATSNGVGEVLIVVGIRAESWLRPAIAREGSEI
jgi:hypothetical protein